MLYEACFPDVRKANVSSHSSLYSWVGAAYLLTAACFAPRTSVNFVHYLQDRWFARNYRAYAFSLIPLGQYMGRWQMF